MPDRIATPLDAVAPELRDALGLFPSLDFSQGIAPFRLPASAFPSPPLSEDLAAIPCREERVPGPAGAPPVRVLVYTPPAASGPAPAILHMHGGGFVMGVPEMNDAASRALVARLGCVVVSVDYRLAPETTWQGSFEDNYAALSWLWTNAAALGVDRSRLALAGESAGAGHAAALALLARDRHRADPAAPMPSFLLLDSPMLDDRSGVSVDRGPHAGAFVWTPAGNAFGWGALLGMPPGTDAVPAAAVPARAADLSGMPPCCITIGALDLFLEESFEWIRRLAREGIAVELHVTPGAFHGSGMAANAPQTAETARLRLAALARAFA